MIPEIAGPIIKNLPLEPLRSLSFKKLDLGPVPIHITNVDVHQTENNGVKLDVDLDWDGKCDIELAGGMIPKLVSHPFALRFANVCANFWYHPGSRAYQTQGQVFDSALPVDERLPLGKAAF
jgi:hypothetical protein